MPTWLPLAAVFAFVILLFYAMRRTFETQLKTSFEENPRQRRPQREYRAKSKHPNGQIRNIREIKEGDVICSDWVASDACITLDNGRLAVLFDPHWAREDGYDPATKTALFVVEEKNVNEGGERTYMPYFSIEIIAKRLNDDGTYNPNGEIILLGDAIDGNETVELVGQMNYDRTAMTYTLPRR